MNEQTITSNNTFTDPIVVDYGRVADMSSVTLATDGTGTYTPSGVRRETNPDDPAPQA